MAGVRISDFATVTQVSSADVFPLVSGSGGAAENKKVAFSDLVTQISLAINPPSESVATLEASDTWYVGTGGDYASVTAALIAASRLRPIYSSSGYSLNVRMKSGFVFAEQILLFGGLDLGFVTLTSEDATVSITRSALTTAMQGYYPAIGSEGGRLPVIATKFVMDSSGTGTNRIGLGALGGNATAAIAGSASYGFTNCAYANVVARNGGLVIANATDITNGGTYGAFAYEGGRVHAKNADASGAGTFGYKVDDGGKIIATGATGTLSEVANTITAQGEIYQ